MFSSPTRATGGTLPGRHSLTVFTLLLRCRLPIAIFFTFLLCAPLSDAATILLPLDKSVVTDNKLFVLGNSTGERTITVEIQNSAGVLEGSKKVEPGESFRFQVPLRPGLNQIRVGDETRDVFLSGAKEPPPPGFLPLTIHSASVSKCSQCHEEDWEIKAGGYPGVCLQCHIIEVTNPRVRNPTEDDAHFRASGSRCGQCHNPHGERNASLIRKPVEDLCGECHGSRGNAEDLHEAFQQGSCMACHDAHISGFPNLLIQNATELCADCHGEGGQGPGDHPDELSDCSSCHDPHGRRGTRLLRNNLDEQCLECHEGMNEGETVHPALDEGCQACHHPHREDDLSHAVTSCAECHEVEGEGGVLTRHGGLEIPLNLCMLCHRPHAAEASRLVRGSLHDPVAERDCTACHEGSSAEELKLDSSTVPCDDCHSIIEDLAADNSTPHEPVAEDGCGVCHAPHLSENPSLLLAPEAELCGECHEVLEEGDGMHTHAAVDSCSDCHAPHGGRHDSFLVRTPDGLCFECHDNPEQSGGELHPALDEGCLSCHQPHSGFLPAVLVGHERELCLECHDDPAEDVEQLHGAVAAGCTGCHEPHQGENDHLLRAAPEALCSLCHPYTESAAGKIVHDPVDDCSNCHATVGHGGDATDSFLATPTPDLCLDCHDDPGEGEGELHPALDEGCLVCHSPHRGTSPGMLVGDSPAASCLECHDDPLEGVEFSHPPVEESCALCHAPHSSSNQHLLLSSGRDLCLECHDDPAEGQNVVHAPVREGCSDCHTPHGAASEPLLRGSGNSLCLECHDAGDHRHNLDTGVGLERFPDSTKFPSEEGIYSCLGCHEAHASSATNMVRNREELCRRCHKM